MATSVVRRRLQSVYGDAGPRTCDYFMMAGTNEPRDYAFWGSLTGLGVVKDLRRRPGLPVWDLPEYPPRSVKGVIEVSILSRNDTPRNYLTE